MFVDTDLLRIGADFSQSASVIVQRGADEFTSTQLTIGIFGDFDAAHGFHQALQRAHEEHVTTMQRHRVEFDALAQKATSAAAIFMKQDEANGSALASAGHNFS